MGRWVFPVGRLDRDSSGLLIFTNDHRLGQRLTDPGHAVPKTYHARVEGVPSDASLDVLREGVSLGDGTRTRPAQVRSLGSARGGTWLEVVLTEGKNRQVRRMCAAVGHEVLELVRVGIGGLELGELPPGRWRRLEAVELARLAPRPPAARSKGHAMATDRGHPAHRRRPALLNRGFSHKKSYEARWGPLELQVGRDPPVWLGAAAVGVGWCSW